jgi:hypothetical protein
MSIAHIYFVLLPNTEEINWHAITGERPIDSSTLV